jgi:chemotaxis protein MotB
MSDPDRRLIAWEGGDPDAAPPSVPANAWMFTFADLVSLMLTFFVLLFAMSGVKDDRWQAVVDTLSHSLNPTIDDPAKSGAALRNIEQVTPREAISLPYLSSLFEAVVADTPLLKAATVRLTGDRLVLSLPADAIFSGGGTAISPAAMPVMKSIGEVLNGLTNQLAVAVHTSPMAEGGNAFRSNWEFSLARAAAVANHLRSVGVGQRIRIYGMADGRFDDLPELPPAERLVSARRIDIVILPGWRRG